MEIDYQKFTSTVAGTISFYVESARKSKSKGEIVNYHISMASAAAVFYTWLDMAEGFPADAIENDATQLKAIIQAEDPSWPPTEESVQALKAEVEANSKR